MSAEMVTQETLAEEIERLAVAKLRERYPYMKIKAVQYAAEEVKGLIDKTIEAQTPVMEASQSCSGFLKLSAELRNQIYELVLVARSQSSTWIEGASIYAGEHTGEVDFSIECWEARRWDRDRDTVFCMLCYHQVARKTRLSKTPALLRISRQIRAEASPVYYGMNTFACYPSHLDFVSAKQCLKATHRELQPITAWLTKTGKEQAALITDLRIGFSPPLDDQYRVDRGNVLSALAPEQYGLRISAIQVYTIELEEEDYAEAEEVV